MNIVSLEQFVLQLDSFRVRDVLTPAEASRLQLLITELLVDRAVDQPLLKYLSRFFTQALYDELVEERNIEHICGYIRCALTPTVHGLRRTLGPSEPVDKYQIYRRRPSMILPTTYLSQYCCKEHYQALVFYRSQLSSEAVFARKDITLAPPFPPQYPLTWYENGITSLEDVIAKHKELKQQGILLSEVVAMMSGLSVLDGSEMPKETTELVQMLEDFQIVEKAGDLGEEVADDEEDGEYITDNRSFGGHIV